MNIPILSFDFIEESLDQNRKLTLAEIEKFYIFKPTTLNQSEQGSDTINIPNLDSIIVLCDSLLMLLIYVSTMLGKIVLLILKIIN